MRVHVVYTVPVIAVIEDDEVVSVHVIDEEVGAPTDVTYDDGVTAVLGKKRARSIEVAETAMWPSWEFGF